MKNVINKIKGMNKKKKIILVSILLSAILLIVGVSYAYYSANVKEVNKTQTVIKTNELEIIFTGTSEITASGIVPGESFKKTFTVENVSNIPVTYNIYLENITNEFDEDLVYTLTDDNGEVIAEEVLPSDSEKTYLITDVEIEAEELKTYTMKIEFKYTDKDQNHLQGAEFKATLGVDTKKVTVVKVVNDKLDLEKMENGTLTKTFIVKNLSEISQNYDIKLSDVVNSYGDNITYSLSKNGQEVISNQVMPSSDGIILANQRISGLTTDEYTMTIKAETKTAALNLIAQTEDFTAKLIVEYEESGIEKTINKRLALDTLEKGKSVTTNISVENTSNKTRTYAISLDDFIATYAEGLVYSVTKNGKIIIETTDLPTANKVMIENQEISAKKTDEYIVTVTKEEGIVKTASKIATTSITAGNTKTVTLTVENKSSKSGTYNVSLSDFVSNYASGLMYTVTKNGTTVVSYQDMPTSAKMLFTEQTISSNGKDTYIIKITKEEGIVKTASKIATTSITAGNTKTVTLTVENKSSKSGTYNVSLSDFVSDYASGLTYTLTKNNTTIKSETDLPTSNTTLLSSQTITANGKDTYVIKITKELQIICKRATELHTESCLQSTSTTEYCRAAGYNYGANVTYGKLGTKGNDPVSGDAYDCDVDGNGLFGEKDETTGKYKERFYYMTTLYGDTATLIYYNNVTDGKPDNVTTHAYNSVVGYYGPKVAVKELPTIEQWPNVTLKNTEREMLDGKFTFSYEGYAARLISTDINYACGYTIGDAITTLKNCTYLLENTRYTNPNTPTYGYWLENVRPDTSSYVYSVVSNSVYGHVWLGDNKFTLTNSTFAGVRPVIEVPIDQLEK